MTTFARLALAAVLVLVLAACASSSGQPWTPPPVPTETDAPAVTPAPASAAPSAAPASAEPSGVPASAAPSDVPASAAPSAAPSDAPSTQAPASPDASVAPSVGPSAGPSGEPAGRVIELEMNAALQILQDGAQIKDIPVTPGETVTFRITNTAGYVHNFWIGPDQALMLNQTEGLPGIPDWTDAEPREFTWVVPDDIAGLKYGCTVPGHYSLMQGVFSAAP